MNSVVQNTDSSQLSLGARAASRIHDVLKEENARAASHAQIYEVSLVEHTPETLAVAIVSFVKHMLHLDPEQVITVINLTAELHAPDVRYGEKGGQQPYIIHPLRNTLRLVHLGATNISLLMAAILHDTVEDHPFELAMKAGITTSDESTARKAALSFLATSFGSDTARIVEGMSNPVITDKNMTREQFCEIYVEHVRQATADPMVFACKVSDFIDNAVALVYEDQIEPARLLRMAKKYYPALEVLMTRLDLGEKEENLPISSDGIRDVRRQLEIGRERLGNVVRGTH